MEKRFLPRWARIAVVVYLSVTVAAVGAALVIGSFETGVEAAWCGISGCSGGGFGVATGSERLAVTMTVVNGLILAEAVFAVPWLYPRGRRALIALAAGALFDLVGVAVTRG